MTCKRLLAATSLVISFALAPAMAQAVSTVPAVNQSVVTSVGVYDDNGNLIEVRFEYTLVCDPDFNCSV